LIMVVAYLKGQNDMITIARYLPHPRCYRLLSGLLPGATP
jgi:hypothetical protein